MVATPIGIDHSQMRSPWSPPYTVDTLFELPETDFRFEVLEGQLVVSPVPTPVHADGLMQLALLFHQRLPAHLRVLPGAAVRMPDGDGPVPDLLVTSATELTAYPKGLPAHLVHTVVEVVSPSNARNDRVIKTRVYAKAGIPCYWRLEQRRWREHRGPTPAIVVRLRGTDDEWQQLIAPPGRTAELPVAVDAKGTIVTVPIDPVILSGVR